jgi:YggT family protein
MNPIEWLLLLILKIEVVRTVMDFTARVTYPMLKPIRNVIPSFGGLDISPVILIIGLMFLQQVVLYFF